jgi:hypothetical protein
MTKPAAALTLGLHAVPADADTGRRLHASEHPEAAALAGPPAIPGRRPDPVPEETASRAAQVILRHPEAVRPWERLGRYALEHGDLVSAYAYFAAAVRAADTALAALGYRPGDRLSWNEPANQPVIQASCGLGLTARAMGASAEARALQHRTLVPVADSPRGDS